MSRPKQPSNVLPANVRLRRRGYTLLELLLALGLTVVVLSIISGGIYVNLFSLSKVQQRVERKQVARSVLRIIQNDVRAGVQYKANDYSGLTDLATSLAQVAGQDIGQSDDEDQTGDSLDGAGGALDALDQEIDNLEATIGDAGTESGAGAETTVTGDGSSSRYDDIPAFVGGENFLTLNISRLPRIDQYSPLIPSVLDDVSTISDVKTVSFFVSAADGGIGDSIGLTRSEFSGGLYRREVDRSVANFAGLPRSITQPDQYSQLLAAEVVRANFRYFSGSQWQSEWDSNEDGGFPLAVEVFIVVDPTRAAGANRQNRGRISDTDFENYRSVIHLPVAEVFEEEELEAAR